MTIPLLQYRPSSQNSRVDGYDPSGDERAFIFTTDTIYNESDLANLINAAYRQIYFHAFKADREPFLESQLRNGQITVRDFIRGLLLSNTYLDSFYSKNSNYRFVEQCVQRVLGRDVYSEREKLAWSIIIGTKGVAGFVDELLGCDEYLENFGYDTVPYQRRRVLAGRASGETPFNIQSPRYDGYYRNILGFPKVVWQNAVRRFTPPEKVAKAGDPGLDMYMDMARSANIPKVSAQVSAQTVSLASVPYR